MILLGKKTYLSRLGVFYNKLLALSHTPRRCYLRRIPDVHLLHDSFSETHQAKVDGRCIDDDRGSLDVGDDPHGHRLFLVLDMTQEGVVDGARVCPRDRQLHMDRGFGRDGALGGLHLDDVTLAVIGPGKVGGELAVVTHL